MYRLNNTKILLAWLVIAIAMAFYGHFSDRQFPLIKPTKSEPDTCIHFSFNKNQKNQLSTYFEKYTNSFGYNGVFLVGQKDSVFFYNSHGYSDFAKRDTFSINSSFQMASVSKQFTAVAILQLHEQGKLNIYDSLSKYIPEIPYQGITIHQMLCHRSGLPNYHYFFQHIPTTFDTLLNNEDLVNEITLKTPNIYFRPNRKFQYSNTGYALLAAIVERVSGFPFDVYLKNNIFKPLGMNNSFAYRANPKEAYPVRSTGYLRRWRMAEDNYLDGVLGDKGIYSSPKDLFLWDQGLYNGSIVNYDTLQLAFKPAGKPIKAKVNYGYGWRMYSYGEDSIRLNFHFGWWHGFRSLIMRIPHDSTTVIAIKNRSAGKMMNTKSIMKILYPKIDTTAIIRDSLSLDPINQ